MHVAEMDFEIAEPIKTKLTEMVRASDIGYLGPLPELAAAFESFFVGGGAQMANSSG